ncbi:MAG: anhydro-N-acetylmuramic acid kinase [Flavobacteriales bacterium]|nr:anhydro-N-acetylmuramic acid kinase [Flavobacteriales bacterium]
MEGPYHVIGVMSGSSLDGLDVAYCRFVKHERWEHAIEDAVTVPYDEGMRKRLLGVMKGSALDLARLDRDLGRLIARACNDLRDGRPLDLIASHGHTIFHQPGEGLTTQIGNGAQIAALTGRPTVFDLRSKDVALGGQGAPLVPFGERMLFAGHDAFLNLGGIANVAHHGAAGVTGYDICTCNQALNALAMEAGRPYDADGALARSGAVNTSLLHALDALPFLRQPPPRSLGRERYEAEMAPLLGDTAIALNDRLRTATEHVAAAIGAALRKGGAHHVLVTGGGAHNGFLLERIAAHTTAALLVPDRATVDFKEALVFAFLGLMRWRGEVNTLASVTGAPHDSIGGSLVLPN